MLKKLYHSLHPSIESFQEILLAPKFNQINAEKMISKINKNYKFDDGDTLLDKCLRKNRFKAASWLVRQGIEITTKNKDNISSVRLAIEKGDIVVIDTITKYCDFNIDQVDQNGRSLLQDAVILGYNQIAQILIDNDIDPNIKDKYNRNVIFDAVNYGDNDIIDTVLKIKNLEMNNIDTEGKTVLHQKTVRQNDDLAVKLLKSGADPTICDKEGYNFLTYTALRGDAGQYVLDIAIECGCDLNSKTAKETSVLMEVMHAFVKAPSVEIDRRTELKNVAQTLIDGGSDINSVNQYGETMIFSLIRKGDLDGCAFLLQNKIDINQINNNSETPLFLAVLKGSKYMQLIKLLLGHGADPTIRNKYEQTIPEFLNEIILHTHKYKTISTAKEYIASIDSNGQYMIILKEILSLRKFNFHYYDTNGNPLFYSPFLYGDKKTTQLYLQNGFNINEKNESGVNLFYTYVLECFKKGEYFNEFREYLVFLLVNKADIRVRNKEGQTIHNAVALIPDCNLKLFRKLTEVTKHDYASVDKLGRTIIHYCVISNNVELFNLVYGVERNIQNVPDNFNILPITYAALMNRQEIVIELLKRDTIINSGKPIPEEIKVKYRPILKNLDNLAQGVEDPILLRQIEILKQQTINDFS